MRNLKAMAGRLIGATVLVAGGAGLTTAMAGTAQASVTPDPTWNEVWAPYQTAHANTLCTDDPSGSASSGTAIQLFHCHGYASDGAPQRWHFTYLGNEFKTGFPLYTITNASNGLCLTGITIEGRLVQQTCDDRLSTWELHSENLWASDPDFVLVLAVTGADGSNNPACMAAGNSSDNNQTPLLVSSCNLSNLFSNSLQVWRLG
jgi:hypothetical protein